MRNTETKSHLSVLAGTLALIASSAYGDTGYTAGSYQIDSSHSKVGFEVPHLVISTVEGRFNEYQGEIQLADAFEKSKVSILIDTGSIDTGIKKRDDHLKSPDFFDTGKYPKITFKSKRITGSPESFKVIGDLTMKGVTREVALESKYLGSAKDGYGNLKSAFEAKSKIKRKDFGLTWSNTVEGAPVVGDEISLDFKIQGALPLKK